MTIIHPQKYVGLIHDLGEAYSIHPVEKVKYHIHFYEYCRRIRPYRCPSIPTHPATKRCTLQHFLLSNILQGAVHALTSHTVSTREENNGMPLPVMLENYKWGNNTSIPSKP